MVTLCIGTFNVQCVLVDQDNSVEVVYYSLFKDLKISDTDLRPSKVPLIRFNGAPIWPLGTITLPVRAGSVVLDMEFVVVDVPSPNNAIDDLYGDQTIAKRCYVNAVRSSKQTSQVNLIEVPDALVLEDVGRPANEKAIEDLVSVPITEDGSRSFLVGSSLSDTKRNEMVDFFNKNKKVFAWTPYEMPRVDPSFICHELNIDRAKRPIVQRARRSSPVHSEAVIEEVHQLLNAKVIQEVQYPRWLANTVVVKKKNGKWRVCIDHSNLNDACPKDFFPLSQID
ncbi:uncharacterized protein LOC131306941 [Rhododendron vialii]|uniref:uncharacterized protein LOC131306941 n=1 Tax=Rhododendron vialii TaxID=182163 RepID=UPI00266001DA|nr:uncharacterized protein LOC131306941 [Rhododendron vialii]